MNSEPCAISIRLQNDRRCKQVKIDGMRGLDIWCYYICHWQFIAFSDWRISLSLWSMVERMQDNALVQTG